MDRLLNNEGLYDLVGINGNAFSVMAYVDRCMREENYSKDERDAYVKRATSSDYNNLLNESINMVEECNNKMKERM